MVPPYDPPRPSTHPDLRLSGVLPTVEPHPGKASSTRAGHGDADGGRFGPPLARYGMRPLVAVAGGGATTIG